jgi:hypothetical protein
VTPEQIVACSAEEVAGQFQCDIERARIIRKRAKQTLWQRKYRREGRALTKRFGYLDGPPIARCREREAMERNAVEASAMLKARILQVFGA